MTLLTALCLLAVGAGADGPSVRFLEPRELATVLGASTVVLGVTVPPGGAVARIELKVDGKPLRLLTAPPWEAAWDAGEEGRAHTLEARLTLTDGREARATLHTSALRIDQVENVELVNLYLVVRDREGQYVTDLGRDDFAVLEDGRTQAVERFSATHEPLRVGIVLDSSLSMLKQERLEHAKKAALEFIEILEPGDEATVVHFNDFVHIDPKFTSSTTALAARIEGAVAHGGTALYDAVWKTARLLEGFDGRRVMVLLSDGRDEAANGIEPGSLHTLEEALDQALRGEVMVFTIGLGADLEKNYVRRWDRLSGLSNVDTTTSLADLLRSLAQKTGGRAVMSDSPARVRKAFAAIADDLRHQYSIAYSSSNPARDGKWRQVEVRTPGRELDVITRKGYFAPKPQKSR